MIETKTEDYKSHKHEYNVFVEINSKTKLGQNLLEQYHKQAKRQYIDVGRIGYHDDYGRYIIDHYTLFELVAVPKLIISVTEKAIDRAGRDIYKLRTYMSKFGQLNFLLLVDKSCAELILVENIYIENLNHRENYETLIYKLRYSPSRPVPLREIFYKFGIRANPDDYGRAFKSEEASINNLIVATAKASLTIALANKVASSINQKALLTSLNYLNKEGTYGKNVTKEYSKKVAKSKELNDLSASPKLESTLNHVLVKTLEQQTTKADVKDKTNYKLYKKVLDVEMSSHNEVKKEVSKLNTKQNLKEYLLDTYQKHLPKEDEEKTNKEKFKTFERIIEKQYSDKPNKEPSKPIEEDFKPQTITTKVETFYDFNNKKVDIDFNLSRFNAKEDAKKKQVNKQLEKLEKKQEKKQAKLFKAQNKNSKILNAECNLDEEFERSKLTLGILPTDSKRKKKKALKIYFSEDNKKQDKKSKQLENSNENAQTDNKNNLSIIEKIEKQIRGQKVAKQDKKNKKSKKSFIKKQNNTENNILENNFNDTLNINLDNNLNSNLIDNPNKLNSKKAKNALSKKHTPNIFATKQSAIETPEENETLNAENEQLINTKKVNKKALKKNKKVDKNKDITEQTPTKPKASKSNQSVISNLKNKIVSKIPIKTNKKTNDGTLTLQEDIKQKKTTPNIKTVDSTQNKQKPISPEIKEQQSLKTKQSAVNSRKIKEINALEVEEAPKVEEPISTKQEILKNIEKEKRKKLVQQQVLYDDVPSQKEESKTDSSIISSNATKQYKQEQNFANFNEPRKKNKPKDFEREM